ncbi:hypothetical protein I4U23_009430 [Adineta vaga]|nr:hypothetical protein I4U23_009430 [Adineta vaga]
MGSASCKNSKSTTPTTKNEDNRKIKIGVFGLDDAGKTTAVKAIEGAPTKDVTPTIGSNIVKVPYPTVGKGKTKSQERIEMIDVCGKENFRERSWSTFYDQIHGFIFVMDASNKKRVTENKMILNELLEDNKLRDKPMLILANKQDQKNAIKFEDHLKDKLDIEELKRKHRIEFCAAIPKDKNKTDEAIRQGFSWLIGEIESDYKKLDSRVNNTKNSSRPKSPSSGRKSRNPTLPQLDSNKTKRKSGGYDTYSDNDDDKDFMNRTRSRPNISIPISDRIDRDHSLTQSSLAATSGFNKKKKLIGAGNGNNDLSTHRSTTSETKPFRSTYETFPDDIPWTSSSNKSTKLDNTLTPKSYVKQPMINDPLKRSMSPLVRDFKSHTSTSLSKPEKDSDDEINDKYNTFQKDKNKFAPTSFNRLKDDDDIGRKTTDTFRSSNFGPAPRVTSVSQKPFKIDDNSDNEYGYPKKPSVNTTKRSDYDDDDRNNNNKTYDRSLDRFKANNDRFATTPKPLSPKPTNRSTTDTDDYLGRFSKPVTRFPREDDDHHDDDDDDDDDDKYKPKPATRHKLTDDEDDLPSSSTKFDARSKYGNDYSTSSFSKPVTHSKFDDNARPSSPYRSTTLPKYGDDNRSTSLTRFNNDTNRTLPSPKAPSHSKYSDDVDDRPSSLSKGQIIHSKNDSNVDNRRTSTWKPSSHSRYSDDDDDYRSSSLSKAPSRSNYDDDDDDRSAPLSKIPSRSKLNEEHDNDYRSFSSKKPSRPNYEDDDDDRRAPLAKTSSRPNYDDDDDDDDRHVPLAKTASRSRYDDDDDLPSSSSKPPSYSTLKGGPSNARIGSSTTDRFRTNPYSDY